MRIVEVKSISMKRSHTITRPAGPLDGTEVRWRRRDPAEGTVVRWTRKVLGVGIALMVISGSWTLLSGDPLLADGPMISNGPAGGILTEAVYAEEGASEETDAEEMDSEEEDSGGTDSGEDDSGGTDSGDSSISVEVSAGEHGTVNGRIGTFSVQIPADEETSLAIQADTGYVISSILINGMALSEEDLGGILGDSYADLTLDGGGLTADTGISVEFEEGEPAGDEDDVTEDETGTPEDTEETWDDEAGTGDGEDRDDEELYEDEDYDEEEYDEYDNSEWDDEDLTDEDWDDEDWSDEDWEDEELYEDEEVSAEDAETGEEDPGEMEAASDDDPAETSARSAESDEIDIAGASGSIDAAGASDGSDSVSAAGTSNDTDSVSAAGTTDGSEDATDSDDSDDSGGSSDSVGSDSDSSPQTGDGVSLTALLVLCSSLTAMIILLCRWLLRRKTRKPSGLRSIMIFLALMTMAGMGTGFPGPGAEQVSAATVPEVTASSGNLTATNGSVYFVTGTVSEGRGQTVLLYNEGQKKILARARVKNTGEKEKYLITVPKEALRGNSDQSGSVGSSASSASAPSSSTRSASAPVYGNYVFYVKSKAISGLASSKMTKVLLRVGPKRESQKIRARSKVTLTNLKTKTSLKARASSGLKLTYTSSAPKIVSVTKTGRIKRHRNGKAVITIRQAGNKEYRPAQSKVKVRCRKSTRREQIDGAVAWAIRIARDNRFTYGTGSGAHHFGCYFCGTNYGPRKYMKPGKRYKRTYCCNPFISAAYAHGAKHPKMLAACRHATGIAMDKASYYRFGCWKCVGKPAYGQLQKGDVLVKYNHVVMYVGNHRLVEASGGTWSDGSIAVRHMSKSRYHGFSYVMRYKGY